MTGSARESFRARSRTFLIKSVGLAGAEHEINSRINPPLLSDRCANFAELKEITVMLKFVMPSSFSHIGDMSCEELFNVFLSENEGETAIFTEPSVYLASSSSICGIAALMIKYQDGSNIPCQVSRSSIASFNLPSSRAYFVLFIRTCC